MRLLTRLLVSLAVFIPASGWLGDRFGGKRTFASMLATAAARQPRSNSSSAA
jgi:MFS family permease